jgi:hypothetical protein
VIGIGTAEKVQRHLVETLGARVVERRKAESDRGNMMLPTIVMQDRHGGGQKAIHRVFVRDFPSTAYARFPSFITEDSPDISDVLQMHLRELTNDNKLKVLMRRTGPDGREYEITHPYKPAEGEGAGTEQRKKH